ncbi:uncharacterized protein LOC114312434 [Camellia sinensis]|uniref:uncharacterized protein LOC114312434 n=1 Tax=Camellia sinensis TaxID=4442 RepID=UPI001036CA0E|nr:uncharacterized protein LOC114312434 [Camellia sinensis]
MLFWKDNWARNVCLKDVFPRLYSLSVGKDESVGLVYSRRTGAGEWNLNFRRSLFQWNVEELRRMSTMLLNAPVLREGRRDILSWSADTSGSFSIALAYRWSQLGLGAISKTAAFIWKNVSPHKVQFFGWLAWKWRVKSSSYLHKIGVLNAGSSVNCTFCNGEVESGLHMLLLCPFSWRIWSKIIEWWGIQWATLRSVSSLLNWWRGWKVSKQLKLIWNVVPLAVLWSIWKQRNDCLFNSAQADVKSLCDSVKVRIAFWTKSSCPAVVYSVNDIVHHLQQVIVCLG